MKPDPALRAAATIEVLLGLGFGIGTAVSLAFLARDGVLPMTPFGFRALEGPATQDGDEQVYALGTALVAVCAADLVAGRWLWQGQRRGAVVGALTVLPAMALGVAFALPFLLLGVPVRVALTLAGRDSLR